MRVLIAAFVLSLTSLSALADEYAALYRLAGWPQQREHFSAALEVAQQRYRDSLPPALYQALLDNSNRRFAAQAMDERALQRLREQLPDPQPALRFFDSPLGRTVMQHEVRATAPQHLARHADGLPRVSASAPRQALIARLARALPAREAGAEVSLALAGVAAESLSQMVPGLKDLFGASPQQLLGGQRERLMSQIEADLHNTLLHVYRDLDEGQLAAFAEFAESPEGQRYYRAALQALHTGLSSTP